jgi:rubrerythrin
LEIIGVYCAEKISKSHRRILPLRLARVNTEKFSRLLERLGGVGMIPLEQTFKDVDVIYTCTHHGLIQEWCIDSDFNCPICGESLNIDFIEVQEATNEMS